MVREGIKSQQMPEVLRKEALKHELAWRQEWRFRIHPRPFLECRVVECGWWEGRS
jgi:hypothetical protein